LLSGPKLASYAAEDITAAKMCVIGRDGLRHQADVIEPDAATRL
jgi:hypothetical protein